MISFLLFLLWFAPWWCQGGWISCGDIHMPLCLICRGKRLAKFLILSQQFICLNFVLRKGNLWRNLVFVDVTKPFDVIMYNSCKYIVLMYQHRLMKQKQTVWWILVKNIMESFAVMKQNLLRIYDFFVHAEPIKLTVNKRYLH